MRDIRLTEDHDIDASAFEVFGVDNPAAIVQNVRQRLLHFTQEWFLDTQAGTPWIEDILVKGARQSAVEDILKARIRETPGVLELDAFDLSESGERGIRVEFAARTETGVAADTIEVQL